MCVFLNRPDAFILIILTFEQSDRVVLPPLKGWTHMIALQESTLRLPTLVSEPGREVRVNGTGRYQLSRLDWRGVQNSQEGAVLPLAYTRRINGFSYAVSRKYQEAIQYHCNLASQVWGRDTNWTEFWLREETRKVVAASIRAAFYYLADCIVVPGTTPGAPYGFYKGADKRLIPYMFLLNFWNHQALPSKLPEYAGIPELESRVRNNNLGNGSGDAARKFLKELQAVFWDWDAYREKPSGICLLDGV